VAPNGHFDVVVVDASALDGRTSTSSQHHAFTWMLAASSSDLTAVAIGTGLTSPLFMKHGAKSIASGAVEPCALKKPLLPAPGGYGGSRRGVGKLTPRPTRWYARGSDRRTADLENGVQSLEHPKLVPQSSQGSSQPNPNVIGCMIHASSMRVMMSNASSNRAIA
jgi:hypothetical protein